MVSDGGISRFSGKNFVKRRKNRYRLRGHRRKGEFPDVQTEECGATVSRENLRDAFHVSPARPPRLGSEKFITNNDGNVCEKSSAKSTAAASCVKTLYLTRARRAVCSSDTTTTTTTIFLVYTRTEPYLGFYSLNSPDLARSRSFGVTR